MLLYSIEPVNTTSSPTTILINTGTDEITIKTTGKLSTKTCL